MGSADHGRAALFYFLDDCFSFTGLGGMRIF